MQSRRQTILLILLSYTRILTGEGFTPDTLVLTKNVMKCDEIIGAYAGNETKYMVIKCSANTIHGHPISFAKYQEYLK